LTIFSDENYDDGNFEIFLLLIYEYTYDLLYFQEPSTVKKSIK